MPKGRCRSSHRVCATARLKMPREICCPALRHGLFNIGAAPRGAAGMRKACGIYRARAYPDGGTMEI